MLAALFCLPATLYSAEPLTRPIAAIVLPDGLKHPDGLTLNRATGDKILAVPVVGDKGNAWLMRIDANRNVHRYFELPAHPETGRVTPLGIVFGADGHLYVADAQQLGGNPNHKGRILRVVHDNGRPIRTEVLVTGLVQPNGMDIHNGILYVAETQIDPDVVEMPMTSGVFAFRLSELSATHPIHVRPYGTDPRFIFSFQTTDATRNGEWKVGANGIGLSADGTLYVANFGDKTLIEIKLDSCGMKVLSSRTVNDPAQAVHESVDGIKVCHRGFVFFADYVGNSIHVMNPANGKTIMLARNALNPNAAQKRAGAFDRSAELGLRGNFVYVSNIDLETPEPPHTVSVVSLEGLDLNALLQ